MYYCGLFHRVHEKFKKNAVIILWCFYIFPNIEALRYQNIFPFNIWLELSLNIAHIFQYRLKSENITGKFACLYVCFWQSTVFGTAKWMYVLCSA